MACGVATYYLSKGRRFIVQDLLASWGLPYSQVQERLILLGEASFFVHS